MSRVKTLLVIVLLFSYGAVGARQPAVRGEVRLPVPAQSIAAALGLSVANRSTLLLEITRLVYDTNDVNSPRVRELRTALRVALWNRKDEPGETVPLPLDPSIWRDTLLQQQIADKDMVAAIVGDRRASLMYHGLSALDDETLAWLGPDRETLLQLRDHPGTFAVFGRAVRVRAGRVLVPGGDAAEPLWESLVGASPSRPSAFVQRLFRKDRTAFLYDAVAHLDPARQRFALGLHLPESSRRDRFVALADVFEGSSPDWRPEIRPFVRPQLDPEFGPGHDRGQRIGHGQGPDEPPALGSGLRRRREAGCRVLASRGARRRGEGRAAAFGCRGTHRVGLPGALHHGSPTPRYHPVRAARLP